MSSAVLVRQMAGPDAIDPSDPQVDEYRKFENWYSWIEYLHVTERSVDSRIDLTNPEGFAPRLFYGRVMRTVNGVDSRIVDNMFGGCSYGYTTGQGGAITGTDFTKLLPHPSSAYPYFLGLDMYSQYYEDFEDFNAQMREAAKRSNQFIPADSNPAEFECRITSALSLKIPPEPLWKFSVTAYSSLIDREDEFNFKTAYSGYALINTTVRESDCYQISKPGRTCRMNNSTFTDHWQQQSFAREAYDAKYMYVFGRMNGSRNGVQLARVTQDRLADMSAYPSPYLYWDGNSWSPNDYDAIEIITDPIGDMSVIYHAPTSQWLMLHFSQPNMRISLRKAPNPWGPWSAEEGIYASIPVYLVRNAHFLERSRSLTSPLFTLGIKGKNPQLHRLTV